jgi:hypothetical protein
MIMAELVAIGKDLLTGNNEHRKTQKLHGNVADVWTG